MTVPIVGLFDPDKEESPNPPVKAFRILCGPGVPERKLAGSIEEAVRGFLSTALFGFGGDNEINPYGNGEAQILQGSARVSFERRGQADDLSLMLVHVNTASSP